jgi:cysteine synthase A
VTARTPLAVFERPRVCELEPGLHAIVFDLIKLVAARHVLAAAKTEGRLPADAHVFESTSGSMGLALALACSEHGLRLTIVGDDAIDADLGARLRNLGAEVVTLPGPFAAGGPQGARIAEVERRLAAAGGAGFWTRQYDNPAVTAAYVPLADDIAARCPRLDVLVAPVGTGASACGLITGLRTDRGTRGDSIRLIAVDTPGSVLFGQLDAPRVLRGLGNSIVPANVRHELVDACHWVAADEAFAAVRALYRRHGIDAGPSSGAAFLVAAWCKRAEPDASIAFVCADGGERYRRLLDEGSLRSRGLWRDEVPRAPIPVHHPRAAPRTWSWFDWRRRSLADVLASPP